MLIGSIQTKDVLLHPLAVLSDTLGQEITCLKIDLLWIGERSKLVSDPSLRGALEGKIRSMMASLNGLAKEVRRICIYQERA